MNDLDLKIRLAAVNTAFVSTTDRVVNAHLKYVDLMTEELQKAPVTARRKIYESKSAVLKTLAEANAIRYAAKQAVIEDFKKQCENSR